VSQGTVTTTFATMTQGLKQEKPMFAKQYPRAEGSVLVTGTSTGIGRASAALLANAGFHVFAGVRKPEDADKVQGLATAGRITPVIIDVADAASVARALEKVSTELAEKNSFLAGVVSNAGVGMIAPVAYLNEDILHYQTQTNLLGTCGWRANSCH